MRDKEVDTHQCHQGGAQPACPWPAHPCPHQQPGQQCSQPTVHQIGRLIAPKHSTTGKGPLCQIAAVDDALAQRDERAGEQEAGQHQADHAPADQQGQQGQRLYCTSNRTLQASGGGVPQQMLGAHCAQHGHAQRKGKDPTKRAVQLVPAGQPIKEQRVKRRAKSKKQRDDRQRCKKAGDPAPWQGRRAVTSPKSVGCCQDSCSSQQPGHHPHVAAPFDIVFDAPEDDRGRLAQRIGRRRLPETLPEVKPAMMAGIAEQIGQREGEEMAAGPGPAGDLLQRCIAFTKVVRQQFDQRDQLGCADSYAEQCQGRQPAGQPQRAGQGRPEGRTCPQAPIGGNQPHPAEGPSDQQRVVDQLWMPCQDHQPDYRCAGGNVRDREKAAHPLFFLLANDELDHSQQKRQPGDCRQKHREDDAGDQKAAEHVDDRPEQRRQHPQTQHPAKPVQRRPSDRYLQRREPAIGDL